MQKLGGYGWCWREPLAQGRWARFKQIMREPMTKTTVIVTFAFALPAILGAFVLIKL